MATPTFRAASRWLVVLAGALSIGVARADVFVHVIQNNPTSNDASIVPSSALPSADFISPDINFNTSNSDGTTLAAFLNNPSFSNTRNGFDASQSADNIFLRVTGFAKLNAGGNSFVVGHDDGVVLTFADPAIGVVVNEPGPTAFRESPFIVNVGAAGLYAFDLKYVECCSGPANLVFQINGAPVGPPIPEPTTTALLLAGLGTLGWLARRRRPG